jgi:hypothetical protein
MRGRGKDIVQAGNTVLVSVPAQIVGNAYFRERGRIHWGALQRGFDALAAAGYAVVPVEPTEVMLLEGNLAAVNSRQSGISGMSIDAQHRNIFRREIACYRAMLAAAGEGGA